MAKWIFQPAHSGAEFAVRHMMVSHMRGLFKNVHGSIDFDPDNPAGAAGVEATIEAAGIWTGDDARDAHLRGPNFLDVATYPEIAFRSTEVRCVGEADLRVRGDLVLRGITRPVVPEARYLGRWQRSYWEGGKDLGPTTRIGFLATTVTDPPRLRRELERADGPRRHGRRRRGRDHPGRRGHPRIRHAADCRDPARAVNRYAARGAGPARTRAAAVPERSAPCFNQPAPAGSVI